jgi:hypothetical protein
MRWIISGSCLSAGLILFVFWLPGVSAPTPKPVLARFGQGYEPLGLSFLQVGSATPTQTATTTPTFTITPTLTSTSTSGLPAYPGITPSSTDVIQPTVLAGSDTPTSENAVPTEIQPMGTISPTATLIPFPTVSMVFPTNIASATIAPSNDQENAAGAGSGRLLLVVVLLLLWSVIIAWFWLVQRRA